MKRLMFGDVGTAIGALIVLTWNSNSEILMRCALMLCATIAGHNGYTKLIRVLSVRGSRNAEWFLLQTRRCVVTPPSL